MSITATEAARILGSWTDSARPPMVAVHGDWKRTHRPLTKGEIQRGLRYLEREALHRKAREDRAVADERDHQRQLRDERLAADELRRQAAAESFRHVAAARERHHVVCEAQADLHEALGSKCMADALRKQG